MGCTIHPTALVDARAELGDNVTVGPYAVIGPEVRVGDDSEVMHHVVITGPTTIGRGNRFFPTCVIGQDPQDKKYHGEADSALEIGDGNTIREFVTINRGSEFGGGITRVGMRNWIMAYCHIAHDCQVGHDTVFANGTTLAGHVTIGNGVVLGGFTAIHQFCRVGTLAITGGMTKITQDVPPFLTVSGNPVRPYGVNKIGLERNELPREEIQHIRRAYRIFYRSGLTAQEALEQIQRELAPSPAALQFAQFIRASERGVCR